MFSEHRSWDWGDGSDTPPRCRRLLPAEALTTTARRAPNEIGARCRGRNTTWAELDSLANRVGNALLARGLRPGDVVGVRTGNETETMALIYGLARSGLVQLPLNPRYTESEVDHQVRAAGAAAVVGPGGIDLADLLTEGADSVPDVDVQEDDPCRIRFSAGTTGTPKMFYFKHRSLYLLQQYIALELRYQDHDVLLTNAPLAHAAFDMTAAAVLVGAQVVLQPTFVAETVWKECDQFGITQLFAVPTMLALALESPGDGASIRGIAVSAAAFPDTLKQRVVERFPNADVTEMYGASELGFVTALRGEDWRDHRGSVGQPRFGYRVRILGRQGEDLSSGQIGDIYCHGPAMSEGYMGDIKGTPPPRDGWVSAGDMGWLDPAGYLYIADRRTDLIVSGGHNIYPAEVENVLLQVPGVREAAVVGVSDGIWGARVVAVVSGDAAAEALEAHAERVLASFKRPREYRVVADLPKSSTGKILRREVRDMLGQADPAR
ncbi:MAG: acyl--CoA ligase [Acidimicrobiaceae bacterium]|nr:acyl--CoA ligase [Acidimicrobiaceae bacterium]